MPLRCVLLASLAIACVTLTCMLPGQEVSPYPTLVFPNRAAADVVPLQLTMILVLYFIMFGLHSSRVLAKWATSLRQLSPMLVLALIIVLVPGTMAAREDDVQNALNSRVARQLAEITVPPGEDTLTTAYNAASPGDTLILLDGTFTCSAGCDSASFMLMVSKKITIRAQNARQAVLDGGDTRGHIGVAPATTVVLEGLVFTNGRGSNSAVVSSGHLTVDNCKFFRNNGTGSAGTFGALAADGQCDSSGNCAYTPHLAIISSEFEDNDHDYALAPCDLHVRQGTASTSYIYDTSFKHTSSVACASSISTQINVRFPFKCKLGKYMTQTPQMMATGVNFRGCLFKCPGGTYGNTTFLTSQECSGRCPVGHYCPEGSAEPLPCPLNTFAAEVGSSVCITCPAFSTTSSIGAEDSSACQCVKGFYRAIDADGLDVCLACPDGSTTSGNGATSIEACECDALRYKEPTTKLCLPCSELEQSPGGTNCSEAGNNLHNLRTSLGNWRQSNNSRLARSCTRRPDSCVGGNLTQQCAPGHGGPLCDLCEAGYHGGRGSPCIKCEGSVEASIAAPIVGFVFFIIICVAGLAYMREKAGEATIPGSAPSPSPSPPPSPPPSLSASSPPEPTISVMISSIDTAMATYRIFDSLVARVGKKLRILISFFQILTQLGLTFSIAYPRFFSDILDAVGSINLSVGALPFACLYPFGATYYFDLLMKTLVPFILILVLVLCSQILRRIPASPTPSGRQPLVYFLADTFDNLWFFIVFLTYPSISSTIINFFVPLDLNGPGEDGVRLLYADVSIDMSSPTYQHYRAYAIIMMIIFPIGVPLLYVIMLFRARHELRLLCKVEQTHQVDLKIALVGASTLHSADERDAGIKAAWESYEAKMEKLEEMRDALPNTVKKLIAGYEFRIYWYEVFECVRKVAVIGVPVVAPTGSPGQLMLGLIICFLTYGMFSNFKPYVDEGDDFVALTCQFSTFFSLLAQIILVTSPNEPTLAVLLPTISFIPVVIAFILETPLISWISKPQAFDKDGKGLARTLRSVRDVATAKLDNALRVEMDAGDTAPKKHLREWTKAASHPSFEPDAVRYPIPETQGHSSATWA